MCFVKSKEYIEYGDVIVVYAGFKSTSILRVEKGKQTQIKYGAIKHDELIKGKYKFGSKYTCAKGICILLAITPELWSLNLPHRTQILYATDISMITSLLYLQPGFKVVEAGTGSGSLSHSIIRTIFPTGHLYTFDFHEERVKMAKQEFEEHRLGNYVTCTHKDVCSDGFGLTNAVDAVFLDLPKPWQAISAAYSALKNIGTTRICCFSPCIEQVQKTVEALHFCNFIDVQTFECLNRPFEFRTLVMKSLNLSGDPDKITDQIIDEIDEDDRKGEKLVKGDDDSCLFDLNSAANNDLDNEKDNKSKTNRHIISTPLNRIPGHTGYLTFATKL